MRTLMNGVYGHVASFEISGRQQGITSQKVFDAARKPSRRHTRASALAQGHTLQGTLSASLRKLDVLGDTFNNASSSNNGMTAGGPDLFKLNKFKSIKSRISQFHTNDPSRYASCSRARPSSNTVTSQKQIMMQQ